MFLHPLSSRRPLRVALSVLGLGFALMGPTGCSKEAKRSRHMERAEKFYAAGELDRAEIEYLNVIQADPKAADAASRLGTIYYDQGRLGRAFEFLSGSVRLNEKDPATRSKLALLLLAVGNRQQSTVDAGLVLDQSPNDPEAPVVLAESAFNPEMVTAAREKLRSLPGPVQSTAPVLVALGILEAKDNKPDAAMAQFEKAIAADPKFAAAHSASGAIFAARRELEKADAAMARAVELSGPRSPRGVQYALFKAAIGDLPGAKKVLEAILAKAPDYLPATLRLADIAAGENRLDEADKLLAGVLKRDPAHPEAMLMSARLALAKRDVDKALSQVQVILRMYPQSPEALFEAGRIYLARNELAPAVSSLTQAIAVNPNYRDAILLLANLNIRQGKSNEAIVALRRLIGDLQPVAGMNARMLEPFFLLAEALRSSDPQAVNVAGTDALKESLAIYDKLEAVLPTSDMVALMRGIVLRQMRKLDEARLAFEAALKRNPESTTALEQLAELDLSMKKPDEAMARIKLALAARPKAVDLILLAARLHMIRGELDLAEVQLRQAIEIQPNTTTAYMLLARIYIDKGNGLVAIENLTQVVDRNPRDTGALFLIGMLHEQRKDYEKARESYEKLLAIDAGDWRALNNLAVLYSDHFKQLDKAFELARRARDIVPKDRASDAALREQAPLIADTLGWILYQRGDYKWALSLLTESVETGKPSAEVKYHLGMTHYMLGDEVAAKTVLEQALAQQAVFPGSDVAKARLAILNLDVSDPSAAVLESLQKHVAANPKDPVAYSRLAAVYEKKGVLDQAVEAQQKAVDANPQNVRAMVALARMLGAKGDSSKALEVGRSARKLAPDDVEVATTLGRLALQAKDFPWAYTLLLEASRARGSDASVQRAFGDSAYAVGRISDARAGWSAAVRLSPDAALSARLALVEASVDRTKASAAVPTAQKVVAQTANDVPALMVLATATTDAKVAVGHLERVLETYPDFVPAKRSLAVLLSADPKEDARVLQLGTAARDQYRDDAELAKAIGLAAYRTGDFRRALSLLDPMRSRLEKDAMYWFITGMSQSKTNQAAPAAESLKKALALGLKAPSAEEAQTALEALQPKT